MTPFEPCLRGAPANRWPRSGSGPLGQTPARREPSVWPHRRLSGPGDDGAAGIDTLPPLVVVRERDRETGGHDRQEPARGGVVGAAGPGVRGGSVRARRYRRRCRQGQGRQRHLVRRQAQRDAGEADGGRRGDTRWIRSKGHRPHGRPTERHPGGPAVPSVRCDRDRFRRERSYDHLIGRWQRCRVQNRRSRVIRCGVAGHAGTGRRVGG
jgi:hypothetical protein